MSRSRKTVYLGGKVETKKKKCPKSATAEKKLWEKNVKW